MSKVGVTFTLLHKMNRIHWKMRSELFHSFRAKEKCRVYRDHCRRVGATEQFEILYEIKTSCTNILLYATGFKQYNVQPQHPKKIAERIAITHANTKNRSKKNRPKLNKGSHKFTILTHISYSFVPQQFPLPLLYSTGDNIQEHPNSTS